MVIERTKTAYGMTEEGRVNFVDMVDGCMTELRFTGKMIFKVLWDLEDAICCTIDYKCILPIILPSIGFQITKSCLLLSEIVPQVI